LADFVKCVMAGRFLRADLPARPPLAARTLPSRKKSGGLVAAVPLEGAIGERSSFLY
jgi:hypothetical protein